MQRTDWALLAIAAAEGETVQPVELQKSLFLLGEKLPGKICGEFYEFEPYDYGPFSQDVYRDAETLQRHGLVSISPSASGKWREYSATQEGLDRAETLLDNGDVDPDAAAYLDRAVEWARGLSFNELIRSIYAHFPDYKTNSVFQDP